MQEEAYMCLCLKMIFRAIPTTAVQAQILNNSSS